MCIVFQSSYLHNTIRRSLHSKWPSSANSTLMCYRFEKVIIQIQLGGGAVVRVFAQLRGTFRRWGYQDRDGQTPATCSFSSFLKTFSQICSVDHWKYVRLWPFLFQTKLVSGLFISNELFVEDTYQLKKFCVRLFFFRPFHSRSGQWIFFDWFRVYLKFRAFWIFVL